MELYIERGERSDFILSSLPRKRDNRKNVKNMSINPKKINITGFLLCMLFIVIILGGLSSYSLNDQLEGKYSIDTPESLLYASYFGGTNDDLGHCIARDSQSNIVIAGLTYSSDIQTTEGVYDTTYNGNLDPFISKWTSDGTELIFSTYLGGSELDT